jgi:signal transduction histidine kinase/CheY-like chemotaxis protein/NAD-dependent dihydropyrimidine dehydrogenase PreA subunit
MKEVIKTRHENCKGCNRCVRECPMEMTNITYQDDDSKVRVKVDSSKCIACGRCVTACRHNARYFEDDTQRFFNDLAAGVSISVIAAPMIITNIPQWKRVFTYLKNMGVKKIYNASIGADICVWANVRYAEKPEVKQMITQSCPPIVSYCEIFRHELIEKLSPIQSPMACAAVYLKEYDGVKDNIAMLSSCIAKANEFDGTDLSQYNVTFLKLYEYITENDIELPAQESGFDISESAAGFLLPMPGGLRENLEYFLGDTKYIYNSEGFNVYMDLDKYIDTAEAMRPEIFDGLNCHDGCNKGSACIQTRNLLEIKKMLHENKKAVLKDHNKEYFNSLLNNIDKKLDVKKFLREYKKIDINIPEITEADILAAFLLLGKNTSEKQSIDCGACGSRTCYNMARKIALGVNIPINCIFNAMETSIEEHEQNIIHIKKEEEQKRLIEVTEEANRAKSLFMANMSHEIRTPMNAIIGMAELLLNSRLSDDDKKYVNNINVSAHSLLGIINDILDMSKIEAGKLTLSPIHYNFKSLIDNVVSMFKYVANNKGIEFKFEVEGSIPEFLYGDDIRVRQVLTNICGNAVKFTEAGYVRLKITASEASEKIIFEIKDTGIGIREEDLPKLFHAFEQSKTEKNRYIAGTGLGLVISKSFVEMMGGSVDLKSEYGKGTVFTINIPNVKGDASKVKPEELISNLHFFGAPEAKILVVDDNEYNLQVACGLLKLFEIKAQTAASGKEAVEMVQKDEYDLVFMDHMMPEMDGIEAAAAIRNLGTDYKNLPIIALTANAIQGAREMFLENNMNDFLSKPIEMPALINVLYQWIPQKKIILKDEAAAGKEEEKEAGGEFWDAISRIEEINTELGLQRVNGIRDMYHDNLKIFYNKLIADNEKMTMFLNSGDIKNFSICVHAVKSMFASVGAQALSGIALSLETASKGNNVEYCLENFPPFSQRIEKLNEQLSHIFPPEAEAEKTPGDETFLRQNVQKALKAVGDYDNDGGIEVLNNVIRFDYGEDVNKLLAEAVKLLRQYKYEEAGEALLKIT